jgi:hypothetical protein
MALNMLVEATAGDRSRSSGYWRGWLSSLAASFCSPLTRLDRSRDVVAAVGAFGRKAIVRTAKQSQIFWR